MLKIQYRIKMKRKLSFDNPIYFTEKMQLYKIRYKNPLLHKLVDKHQVRQYVEKLGLGQHLVKIYGVYDSIADIKFEALPSKFVMKSTNGGGGTQVILFDKKIDDLSEIKRLTKNWTSKSNSRFSGREYAYHGLKGKIIVEELLQNDGKEINDFKFFCFNGTPMYVVLDMDRFVDHKRNIYDIDWNHLKIETDKMYIDKLVEKPNGFDRMLEIAKILSRDFPFVRVDLYNIDGKIFFGELTFYPWSGYVKFSPDEFDIELGKNFTYY